MATVRNQDVMTLWLAKEMGHKVSFVKHPYLQAHETGITSEENFELARAVRRKNGKLTCFLLNGDFANRQRQRRHQNIMRWLVARTDIPALIIPFSALEAASIDKSTVQPREIREDRWTETRHAVEPWNWDDVFWIPHTSPASRKWGYYQNGSITGRPDVRFNRRVTSEGKIENTMCLARNGMRIRDDAGGPHWIERRHWLGDSLFRAKVNGRFRTFISSFDYQETTPLYFLAEVPDKGGKIKTIEDALLALAPPIVHAAMAQGREVKRQGDMFAIPTRLSTEDVIARTDGKKRRMEGVIGTDHVATESYVGKGRITYARGFFHHKPEGRVRDHQARKLGEEWHLVVPNAVPRRRRGIQAARVPF